VSRLCRRAGPGRLIASAITDAVASSTAGWLLQALAGHDDLDDTGRGHAGAGRARMIALTGCRMGGIG
jgi:hypothetical protein